MRIRPAYMLLVLLLAFACEREADFLYEKGRTWEETQLITREYENGTLTDTTVQTTGLGSYDFQRNGKGSYNVGGDESKFEWLLSESGDSLTLCFSEPGLLYCANQFILAQSDTAQRWITRSAVSGFPGLEVEYETSLTRAD